MSMAHSYTTRICETSIPAMRILLIWQLMTKGALLVPPLS